MPGRGQELQLRTESVTTLYPPIEPDSILLLDVGAEHCLYVEECGRPDGVPVVFLHGGPGSGCQEDHRRYFDPAYYRIVLYDQRGSGRSTPLGETAHNGTRELIADLELVRRALGLDRWLVFGGSWGATLALAYAETHASAVLGLVLRGVFLGRQRDLDWFFGPDGAARLLPDAWRDFHDAILPNFARAARSDLVRAYRRAVHGSDPELAARAALAWTAWADRVATWDRPSDQAETADEPAITPRVLAKAMIETHFAQCRYFLDEGELLANTSRLPPVPVSIVHGSRDLVCPVASAWELHRTVPGSRLTLVPEAGHLASEPAMIDALVGETDRLREILS